jgi:hypothetical protein
VVWSICAADCDAISEEVSEALHPRIGLGVMHRVFETVTPEDTLTVCV